MALCPANPKKILDTLSRLCIMVVTMYAAFAHTTISTPDSGRVNPWGPLNRCALGS